ncbi:hypothetical protein OIDMADRAFT_18532 [Oidiodendron maius Zn]|uniref:Uncharacterized protein n=1 Tax=Oidiodendron maius (strain Zn) TaxID=913774 RepID=A0A0C3DM73_OIDMZ|nr:hypothetical protein OIDMADRAFT_18532 [Oidiodendron maius Zn]
MLCEASTHVLLSVQAQARDSPAPIKALRETLVHHTSSYGFYDAIAISCRICKHLQKAGIDYDPECGSRLS